MSWQIFALASAFFAALTAVFGKIGVSELNSNLATFIRTIVILIVTAAFVTANGEWVRPTALPQKSILFLILSGVCTGASWLCYYRALQLGPASQVAPIDKLSVVFVVILGIVVLGEPLTLKVGTGAALIALGAVVMAV